MMNKTCCNTKECANNIPPHTPIQPFALERAAMMFSAMGDPSRLVLLLHLRHKEHCVNELAQLENAKVSSISARLKTLFQANLIQRRRDAKHIYYSLADQHIAELLDNMLEHAQESISKNSTH